MEKKLIGTYRLKHPIKSTLDVYDGDNNGELHVRANTKFKVYDNGNGYTAVSSIKNFLTFEIGYSAFDNVFAEINQFNKSWEEKLFDRSKENEA